MRLQCVGVCPLPVSVCHTITQATQVERQARVAPRRSDRAFTDQSPTRPTRQTRQTRPRRIRCRHRLRILNLVRNPILHMVIIQNERFFSTGGFGCGVNVYKKNVLKLV